jgi:predicted DNA-binding transcriptional regulator YafY
MSSPASRLLEVLELLQSQPVVSGREIADHLNVDGRTARRYIENLQELGIPVEGQRGVGGGYRLRPGFRLPPLMLSDDEVVMVVLGLAAARRLGLDAGGDRPESALEKIHRVLPTTLRRRIEALEAAVAFTSSDTTGVPVAAEVLLVLSDAIRRKHRVRTSYTSFAGERSERELSPYGLVVHSGRWYLAAHDHGRDALRTFRIDRMAGPSMTTAAVMPAPEGFDAVAHVARSLASVPWRYAVEVVLELPLAVTAARVPSTLAELVDAGEQTVLRMQVDSLDWMAGILAGFGCDFTVVEPPELRQSVAALARRLGAQVEPAPAPRGRTSNS